MEMKLRPAKDEDFEGLHALFCVPEVYLYLADGAPPPEEATQEWIDRSKEDRAKVPGVGLLLLATPTQEIAGCVRMHLIEPAGSAELSYVLHPDFWGQGIATAMGWTALSRAFEGGAIDRVVAETDAPNKASEAVMKRLGMVFHRETANPMGPGVEYIRTIDAPPPDPLPDIMTVDFD